MIIIRCKMCGGDVEIAPNKTFGTCDYCGSTMTFPKVDDEQRASAFNRGNHFRRMGEFDKALAVYERIVAEDDTDAEAHWCCALCRFGIEYVEDPATFEYIPTCHRASFDSILEDVDYLAAIEHSEGITRRQYQKDAAKIAEVQRGVLATSQKEEPYDVFICYKETDDATHDRTRDSLDAQEIYYHLTEKGYRVFFSRITLEDKAGAEYEPYIFAALNSAKVMIALGSKPEYFSAVWVKNEWSRFLAIMKKDRAKLLLPCYRGMDPYDLPEQLSVLQSYDMGKIGFMQDLIRGVEKVLQKDAPKNHPTVKEPALQSDGGANVQSLLQRGSIALEDADWRKATELFDRVLDMQPKCAEAYLGLIMAKKNCRDRDEFSSKYVQLGSSLEKDKNVARARQFGDALLKEWLDDLDKTLMIAREAEAKRAELEAQRKAMEEKNRKAAIEERNLRPYRLRTKLVSIRSNTYELSDDEKECYKKLEIDTEEKRHAFEKAKSELESIPEAIERDRLEREIADKRRAMDGLGVFKGKEKRLLQNQIEKLEDSLKRVSALLAPQQELVDISESSYQDALEKENEYKANLIIEALCEWGAMHFKIVTLGIGSEVVFGSYDRPIRWRVLSIEERGILLLSEEALDCVPYNKMMAKITWETCSLRRWLNGEFYDKAFSEEEKKCISYRLEPNKMNSLPKASKEQNQSEKVFLLSIEEAEAYFDSDSDRQCMPSPMLRTKNIYKGEGKNCRWWLRSSGYSPNYAAYVLEYGEIYEGGDQVTYEDYGVRPAIWIYPGE